MQTTTVSNLRTNLKTYVDLVVDNNETVVIPRGTEPNSGMVLMPLSEYNSMKETEFLLTSKVNRERLLASIREIESGKKLIAKTMEELDNL